MVIESSDMRVMGVFLVVITVAVIVKDFWIKIYKS